PLRRVGLYIPGGAAAYPSTVLMVGIPAKVAGVREIALTTPPSKETGHPPDGTLAAAALAGITEVYAIGGAQAIGALAYGTATVPRVDKIVGPGNVYVNLAKRQVFGTVGIDMLAGPSEVAVLVDHTTDPETAARELICQTEHDPLNSALLASSSEPIAEAILAAIERQLTDLPRAAIVRKALAERSFLALTENLAQAIEVINTYAPEHLHVLCAEPWATLSQIENAGAILLGPHSNAALGDYVAGPSHTLPTAGCARFASPLSVDDFLKKSSVLCFDATTASALAETAQIFGRYEGLEGHARAAV
ncbi:histidinol dehydrogenase, partial [Armatimonas sp.]|uniref:histidinol dehydrogenase n=1 Tax=Armatimonas sp. TaxID=1872638 RepID=UPI00286C3A82